MTMPSMEPDTVALRRGGAMLSLHFADGRAQEIPAGALRLSCRCAGCTAERAAGTLHADPAIRITAASAMGSYALQLDFSDGHARGVFPYVFLSTISEQEWAA
ncbi:MAG: DUF971 domain-containing protein [Rhodospirillales bacterium]|nr:DUF971 domain-containing protein [Rhodospirillales bacterium]